MNNYNSLCILGSHKVTVFDTNLFVIILFCMHLLAGSQANCISPDCIDKTHGQECQTSSECQGPLVCKTYTNTKSFCLCDTTFFYNGSSGCLSIDTLKVSAALDIKGTDFITLKWTASKPDTRNVVYYMETNGQSVQASTTSGTIRNLQSGQSYTITIISSLQADTFYSAVNTSVQYGPVSTAYKTHGQECQTSSECQGPLVCKNYINTKTFCLCDTTFFHNGSSGCVSIDTLKVSAALDTKGTDFITLKWTASKPDNRNVVYYMETNGQSVQASTTSGTIRNLQAGQSYTITVISSLQADTFYSTRNTSVQFGPVTTNTKTHGQECRVQTECSNPLVCVNYTSGTQKCLCDTNSYYTDAGGCYSMDIMKVTNVNTIKDTHSIQLIWSSGGINRNNAKYSIETSESKVVTATTDGGTVSNLTPGSPYNFTIKTTLPADNNYPEETAIVPTSVTWTNPTQPGPVKTVQLSTVNTTTDQYRYVITIEKSEGLVKEYTIKIFYSFSELEKIKSTNTTFIAEKLKPVINYSYSIIATNGVGDVSPPRSGTFLTPPSASNEVSDLKVEAITGYSAFIKWQRPTLPNGDIIGYIAVVRDQQQNCVAVHKISCRECNTTAFINPCSFGWNSSQTYDNISLNNQSLPINVTVIGLKPYTIYRVEVSPYSVIGKGLDTSETFITNITAASNLISLSATPTRSQDNRVGLFIAWIPGDFTGPTNYTIVLESEKSLINNNEFQIDKTITVPNFESRNFTFPDLLAYWKYRVSVYAYTSQGAGSTVSIVGKTFMNVPGTAQFQLMSNSTMALDIYITITCPVEQERNGTITGYIILKKLVSTSNINEIENRRPQKIEAPNSCETTLSVLLNDLLVERTYLIQIMTINGQYQGSYSIDKALYTAPKVPRLQEMFPDKTIVEIITTTETTLVAKVCRTCLTDERQGIVKDLMLVVCGEKSDCYANARRRRSLNSFQNWSAAKKSDFRIGYQATPRHWIEQLEGSTEEFVNYIVGSSGNCKSDDNEFCNGPLPSNTKFKLLVIQCNNAGCDTVSSGSLSTQDADDKNIGLWVFLGVGLFLFIILLAGVAFCVKRIHNRRKSEERVEIDPYDKVNRTYQDDHQYDVLHGTSISSNNLMENVSASTNTDNVYHEIHDYSNYPERDIGTIPKLDNNKLNRTIVYDNIAFNSS